MEQKKLGFGLMRLPVLDPKDTTKIDMAQMEEMVDTFLEKGFTYFDTAYVYHKFQSEIAMREALVKRHPRESFTVATKLPVIRLEAEGDQERIFDEQLEKCGVTYFDYYLLHNMAKKSYANAEKFDSFGFAAAKKAEGKIKNLGFSFHEKADFLDEILTAHPEVDFVQLQINYLDWENESVQSRKCWEVARKHGKKIIIMEPVKGGALANVPDAVKKLLADCHPDWSPASWAIRFAASLEGVIMVLSGMSNTEQLSENTAFMADFEPLGEKELAVLKEAAEIISQFEKIPCTACQYCVDGCPQQIPIPEFFAMYNEEKPTLDTGFSENEAYLKLAENRGKASSCIACGQCEEACPQHIEIIDCLKKVKAVFE